MKRDKKYITDYTITKLQNSLKGCAMFARDDRRKPAEERLTELEVIESLYRYVSDYEVNMRKIQAFDDYIKGMEDDGR